MKRMLSSLVRGLAALWLSLGVTVVVLAAIEIGPDIHLAWKRVLRVLDPEGGKADWRAGADTYRGETWTKAYWREYFAVAVDWAPYTLWRARPVAGTHVNVGADGLRRTLVPAGGGNGADVWMLGGSTMFGMGARDDHTIPSELARRSGWRVVNQGQPGWVMAQSAIHLEEELKQGRRPGLVVFYGGINDVFSTMAQGSVGLPQNNDNRIREFNLTADDSRGRLVLAAMKQMVRRTQGLASRLANGPPHENINLSPEQIRTLAERNADYMAATMEHIRALGRLYHFRTLFVLQPVIFSKREQTRHESEAAAGFNYMLVPFQQAYESIRRHPGLGGRDDFLDLSGLFDAVAEGMYVDVCHVGETANAALAAAMADALGLPPTAP